MPLMHDHRIENLERAKQRLPLLYCPFGCTGRDVNPNPNGNAECCHLAGHTIDKEERVFEPLKTAPWNQEFFSTTRMGREKVQPGDIVVNPIVKQMLKGTGLHYAKKWVSARVYRACTSEVAQEWRRRHAHPTDYALEAALAEEDKDAKIKQLELELAALKGAPVTADPEEAEVANVAPWGPPQPGELDDAELEILTAPSK